MLKIIFQPHRVAGPTSVALRSAAEPVAKLQYLPHVDGLRAFAVLSVLLYHFEFFSFRGGYVGVDIFFVISGFLITRLIVREVEQTARFDFWTFYGRRFRRLFPAAAATLLATLIAGWATLTPELYREAALSIVYAAMSVSNIFFAQDAADYFSYGAWMKPALHTWSLSVEEQFYLFWPAILVSLGVGISRSKMLVFLAVASALSLLTAQFWADRAIAFFGTPFRLFEFGVGAALAFVPASKATGRVRELLLAAALLMVAFSIAYFSNHTKIPGIAELVPCLGAAFIIYLGSQGATGLLLRNRIALAVGKLSYSLYLVHWPIFVFYKLGHPDLMVTDKLLLLAASFVCATALHLLVESPCRKLEVRRSINAFLLIVSGLTVVAGSAAAIVLSNGVVSRYPSQLAIALDPVLIQQSRAYTWSRLRSLTQDFALASPNKILVVGDSQAADVVNMLAEGNFAEQLNLATFPSTAQCQLALSGIVAIAENKKDCAQSARRLQRDQRIPAADVVVLSFLWEQNSLPYVSSEVAKYKALGARRVVVVGRKDQGGSGQDILSALQGFNGAERYAAAHIDQSILSINHELASRAGAYVFLDILKSFCPSIEFCNVVDANQMPLFIDPQHLSKQAANHAAGLAFAGSNLNSLLPTSNNEPLTIAKVVGYESARATSSISQSAPVDALERLHPPD